MRASPRWPVLLAAGPTVPRECRVEDGWAYRPGCFDRMSAPALLLSGSGSPPALIEATHRAAAAVPGARVQRLEGHAHLAHKADPGMIAGIIRQFIL